MGILDFFKKKEKNITQPEQSQEQKLVLRYSSGERADVIFGDNIEIDGKTLKQAEICYTLDERKEDSLFIAKKILLEPHNSVIDNKSVEDTYNYYTAMMASGKMGAVKGFFQRQQLDMRKTNYAGILEVNEQGAYRREDTTFARAYEEKCLREKQAIKEARAQRDKTFAEQLAEQNKSDEEVLSNRAVWDDFEKEQTYYGPNDPRGKLLGQKNKNIPEDHDAI